MRLEGAPTEPSEIDFCEMTIYGIEVFFLNLHNDDLHENFVYCDDGDSLRVFTKQTDFFPKKYQKEEWMIYKSIEVLTINIVDKSDALEIKQKYPNQMVKNGL